MINFEYRSLNMSINSFLGSIIGRFSLQSNKALSKDIPITSTINANAIATLLLFPA